MKVSPFFILLTIVGYAQARTRRHLSVIKGDESDASMSYASTLHAAKGSSSRSKSSPTAAPSTPPPTRFPTPPPTPLPTSAPTPPPPAVSSSSSQLVNDRCIFIVLISTLTLMIYY